MICVKYFGENNTSVEIESVSLLRYETCSTRIWNAIKKKYGVTDFSDDDAVFNAIDHYYASLSVAYVDEHQVDFMPHGGGEKVVW